MRVSHVITRLIVGGAQENTIASVLGLAAKPRVDAHLFSGLTTGPEGSLEGCFADQPALLTLVPELVRPVRPLADLLAYRNLLRHFQSRRPHIVHTHSGKAGVLGRLAAAKAGVPVIVHTIHGPSFGTFQGPLPNAMFRAAERLAGRVTTHFVSVADAMTEQYLAAGIGRPQQYSTIHSGFCLEPFLNATNSPDVRARHGIHADDFVVGKIARLFELKGHDELIDVATELVKNCPRTKFLLVGDGEWRGRLVERIKSLGMERHFIFTGLVPPREVPELIGIMDVLVHLSRREGLARALPQALAAGKPVIACDCDGAKEVCLDEQTGFLVPPGEPSALRNRIRTLADHPELRSQMGDRGRKLVQERFDVRTMVDKLFALYSELLKQHGARNSAASIGV